jgi:hypothetical protein
MSAMTFLSAGRGWMAALTLAVAVLHPAMARSQSWQMPQPGLGTPRPPESQPAPEPAPQQGPGQGQGQGQGQIVQEPLPPPNAIPPPPTDQSSAPAPVQPTPIQPAPGQAAVPPSLPPAPASPPPDGGRKPDGFFDALNRWIDKSSKDWKAGLDQSNARWREFGASTEKAAKDAAAAQKEAAEAWKNLPNVRMIEDRKVCEQAPNGSPDCQAAAEAICKGRGFGKGQSADIQTTRKCSAKAYLTRDPAGCRQETVVVKAACQ